MNNKVSKITFQLLVTGVMSSGKTTFIQTLSELEVVSTSQPYPNVSERFSEQERLRVSLDFGRLTVNESCNLHFFGMPGGAKADLLLPFFGQDSLTMLGYIVMFDSAKLYQWREARRVIQMFQMDSPFPVVVAASNPTSPDAISVDDARIILQIAPHIPVLPCEVRSKEAVKAVLLALIEAYQRWLGLVDSPQFAQASPPTIADFEPVLLPEVRQYLRVVQQEEKTLMPPALFTPAIEKYLTRAAAVDSWLCIGLDSDLERLPARFQDEVYPQYAFNRWVIEQTHPYASAYKINTAFYEARGAVGWSEMAFTMTYLREHHPDILTICDAKRADIGSTNTGYVRGIFDELGFDSITLHPYLGQEALHPFLERADKGCIILCRTSNPGAGEFQDVSVAGKPLWAQVAARVHEDWNYNGNCMLVVGATYPDELRQVRAIIGEMPILVPGIGAQGGDLGAVIEAGQGGALIISASRGVIFDAKPGEAARALVESMRALRGGS